MNDKNHKNTPQVKSETLSLIKEQFFKTKMCPFQKNKNYCLNESNCHYAHSLSELKPMPDLRNTKLCDYVKKKMICRNVNCKFAHDIDTLKPSVHLATYKSTICSFWGKGKCFNGNKCRFAHGNEDMKTSENIDILENAKHIKKNKIKNKNCDYDLKQGTPSTNSFNTCDCSINCSLETTNVSSFDKNREVSSLKKNNINKEKLYSKNKLENFNYNKDVEEDRNKNINRDITENSFLFYDKKNENSIKEVIDQIDNMALSNFIENNDKYTKLIKYLLKENNILKESLRKDKINIMLGNEQEKLEQDNIEKDQHKNKASPEINIKKINRKMNSDDLTKYFFSDEDNEKFLNNDEKKNGIHAPTFDSTYKLDENFNTIIKTIDDILISQNIDSFSNIKDVNTNFEGKYLFSVKNNDESSGEYENLLCHIKSLENIKNIYPNYNSFNIIENKPNGKGESEALERLYQQSIMHNKQMQKKKNYYDENINFTKSSSFPYVNNQKKELEKIPQKENIKSIIFSHKEKPKQEIEDIQKRLIQLKKMKTDEFNENKSINSWKDNIGILRNDHNNIISNSNNNNNTINNLNFMPKNGKLNLKENTALNDNSVNIDKLLEFSIEKSDILKKIRNNIFNELKNNENENFTNKKMTNFNNICNDNNNLTTKNTLFSDSLYSTFNPIITDISKNTAFKNNTIINNINSSYNNSDDDYMNDNSSHKANNDLLENKKQINKNENIWNNNVNFNEYTYPILSHGWINNQKNNDFFNISKSINLSSLN